MYYDQLYPLEILFDCLFYYGGELLNGLSPNKVIWIKKTDVAIWGITKNNVKTYLKTDTVLEN